MKKLFSIFALLISLTPSLAHSKVWVPSVDGYDCKITCSEAGYVTPYTDTYKDTNRKFFVCMSNVNNEGKRAGYSLSHEPGCFVAYENTQVQAMDFSCMCG